MKCPVCPESVLVMADRQGVEIDYCPACRGVWLDRGELDKLIEKSAAHERSTAAPPQPNPASQPQPHYRSPPRQDFVDSDFGHKSHQQGYHKRKSWLSDIFD